jgi:hypothetical protein
MIFEIGDTEQLADITYLWGSWLGPFAFWMKASQKPPPHTPRWPCARLARSLFPTPPWARTGAMGPFSLPICLIMVHLD